jgi:hypothetical protein
VKPIRFDTLTAAQDWMVQHGPGRALHLVVLHDERCLHGRNNPCTCRPQFVVEDLTTHTAARGEREERRWLDRHGRN